MPQLRRKGNLATFVALSISDDIARGHYAVGDRLPTEANLEAVYKVSRSVVRDALKLLAGRDLVEIRHGVGTFIRNTPGSELSSAWGRIRASMSELYEVREVLETQGARWAAERQDEADLSQLRAAVHLAQQISSDESAVDYIRHDNEFHFAVARAAHNAVLIDMLETMMDLLSAARVQSLSIPGRQQESVVEHGRILKCIAERDIDGAGAAMLAHLTSAESSILQSLRRRESELGS